MNKKQRQEIVRGLSMLSHIGVIIAACILIGVLFGKFLDNLFGTAPWLLLIFALIGTAAAFKALFDFANKK